MSVPPAIIYIVDKGGKMTPTRNERLLIVQRTYEHWSSIYDDRDDVEANDAYMDMYVRAVAISEKDATSTPRIENTAD